MRLYYALRCGLSWMGMGWPKTYVRRDTETNQEFKICKHCHHQSEVHVY